VQHNLGKQITNFLTVDDTGRETVGLRDTELSTLNLLVIHFSEPVAGAAYL